MESSDLSSGAQKSPEPDFGKKSPEPKRRKLDVLGDDYQPNVYIESEVDGTGNDSGEEDMSTEAYLAYLGVYFASAAAAKLFDSAIPFYAPAQL